MPGIISGSRTELRPAGYGEIEGPSFLIARLSLVTLVEFIVFGAWFATLGLVLASNGLDAIIGIAYLVSAIAAIIAPLFLGALGDRFLAPRNVLALAHVAGAVLLVMLPHAIAAHDANLTLALIFAYMCTFQPTLGLINSISLTLLGDNQQHFPYVRLFGPGGWVVAGLAVGWLGLSASTGVFYFAAAFAVITALASFTLPRTPPPAKGARFSLGDLIGVKALVLFRNRTFAALMFCTLLTSISLGVYNSFASPYLAVLGITNVAGVLALGPISEVVFIGTIPWVLARIGMKWALFFGMLMWSVRFALLLLAGGGNSAYAIGAVALHGICNDYFIVVAAMFIARVAPPQLAAQAQGWLILMVSGFGAAIGSAASGAIYGALVVPAAAQGPSAWAPLWVGPIGMAIVTCVAWLALYRREQD
ncbi:ProP protein [Sphingomonas sp. LH128]|uniref:Nucleoside:proton symporter n=1 Tax=Novosphingobium resinovorum TaxID=158500 RepID=A0A1D8AFE0_9SPHN|nr:MULTISPECIES: MFS transporter [Sphingomonadaceae]AOR80825.1 nucleoside:proton symporter [Novosphingobium resinovorum]EJU08932.1 ProP protein [Sphingomonas sp. LH128]